MRGMVRACALVLVAFLPACSSSSTGSGGGGGAGGTPSTYCTTASAGACMFLHCTVSNGNGGSCLRTYYAVGSQEIDCISCTDESSCLAKAQDSCGGGGADSGGGGRDASAEASADAAPWCDPSGSGNSCQHGYECASLGSGSVCCENVQGAGCGGCTGHCDNPTTCSSYGHASCP